MKRRYFLVYFLVFQIAFLQLLTFFPHWVETYYSNGLYVYISKTSRLVLGKIPFSFGDCLYGVVLLYVLFWLYKSRKQRWKRNLLTLVNAFSVFCFVFHLLWGFNYYREPLFEKMKINKAYTNQELFDFSLGLIEKTNALQLELTKDVNQAVTMPYSKEVIFHKSLDGYAMLAQQYDFFTYSIPSQKESLMSLGLTYMGFSGYLNPFTNEAQVNGLVPAYNLPIILNHEMAHQIGFASESECNFIGLLASIKNKDKVIQYSGCSFALRYCLAAMMAVHPDYFLCLKRKINKGILKNYEENELFWKHYDTIIDKAFHAFYDQFLKVNQQKEGLESYSKFLDLTVNYYKGKPLF